MRLLGIAALLSMLTAIAVACGGGEEKATPTVAQPTPTRTSRPPATATPTSVPPSTTGPVVDTQAGQQVFIASGCDACHTVSTVPGAVGTAGPVLDGLASGAGTRKAGLSAEGYIKESIENPGAFVVQGFINLMPSLRGTMTDGQFGNLVAFLLTLK